MSEKYTSTCDLAIEAHEMMASDSENEFSYSGIDYSEENLTGNIKITRVWVKDEMGERNIGKPMGNYITLEMGERIYGRQEMYENACRVCAKEIKEITDKYIKGYDETVLVAGLGNRKITADSLGPKVVTSLMITRHLKKYIPEEIDDGVRPVCAISPGVLGTTGIETEEIIQSITEEIKPSLVILIDALCSQKTERVNSTIQISDVGLTPGGGVGNRRKTINKDSLKVPVVAIGVPTVVDAATIAAEGADMATGDKNIEDVILEGKIRKKYGNMIVAPKDVDSITDDIASIIANGINIALHRGITLRDIDRYV